MGWYSCWYNSHITCISQDTVFGMTVTSPVPEDSYCFWHNSQHPYPNIFGTTVTKPVPQYSVLCNCYMTWTTSISLYPQHIRYNLSVFNFGMADICFSKLMKQMWALYGWQNNAVLQLQSPSRLVVCETGKHNWTIYMCTSTQKLNQWQRVGTTYRGSKLW